MWTVPSESDRGERTAPSMAEGRLCEALRGLYYSTKVVGMSPYRQRGVQYQPSRWGSFCSLTVALLHFCNSVAMFSTQSTYHVQNIIITIIVTIKLYAMVLGSIYTLINEVVQQAEICKILTRLQHMDAALLKMGADISYRKIGFLVNLAAVTFVGTNLAQFILDAVTYGIYSAFRIFYSIIFIVPSFLGHSVFFIFITHIYLLRQRISIINNDVLRMILIKNEKFFALTMSPAEVVLSCKHLHEEICSLLKQLNKAYGLPLLFYTIICYCDFFKQLYTWFSEVVHPGTVSLPQFQPMVLSHSLVVLLSDLFWFGVTCLTCDKLLAEIKETPIILFKIYQNTTDKDLKTAIYMFVMQVTGRMKPTAGGFIKFNSELIMTMAGSAIIYLVILIQFDLALNE